MVAQPTATKAELLRETVLLAAEPQEPSETPAYHLPAFVEPFYQQVPADDLNDRTPDELLGTVRTCVKLATTRSPGMAVIHIADIETATGAHTNTQVRTAVDIITDDMPFLVESVAAELTRLGHGIHMVFHPILAVEHNGGGPLRSAGHFDAHQSVPGAQIESWIHLEIDRQVPPARLPQLRSNLERILADVRTVVDDWPQMRAAALGTAAGMDETHEVNVVDRIRWLRAAQQAGVSYEELGTARELLRWLADDHFTFLGYCQYEVGRDADGTTTLLPVTGSGLGLLRPSRDDGPPRTTFTLPVEARAVKEQGLLMFTKADTRATVHRPAYLDYIGVKTFNDQGQVTGEHLFLGLFSTSAYSESVQNIPVVRQKVSQILEIHDFSPASYSGRSLVKILESYPRDELFQSSVNELASITGTVVHMQERRQMRLFLRKDTYGRYFSAIIYLPRDFYTEAVRLKLQSVLKEELAGTTVDYSVHSTESVLTRLHFVVRTAPDSELVQVEERALERSLIIAVRSWRDGFAEVLDQTTPSARAASLLHDYGRAFPEGYRADFSPQEAVADVERIEAIHADDTTDSALAVYHRDGEPADEYHLKIFRVGRMITLAEVLPFLQSFGVEVIQEHPYELRRAQGQSTWIFDFGLRVPHAETLQQGADRDRFISAFAAAWSGRIENDGFSALVLQAELTWRQVTVLRSYVKYLRQTGLQFEPAYIEEALAANTPIARLLVELFETHFDPAGGHRPSDTVAAQLDTALDAVASLDEDRILRALSDAIRATLRTNYFQADPEGEPKPYLSFKINTAALRDLPSPRPKYEIWVYAPRFEGVHMRFGPVARGGLRWSDRREDFRTEILGLVKAQMVKNAVIVPVGAKGGFVVKTTYDPTQHKAFTEEGTDCYRNFIRGMLDITDNLILGSVVPPPRVVRRDGDDPYLVVAADKGTAAFSDTANGVAAEYDFWLGDAFASGGSAGYDHKAMGITARGAWESAKRHFRELDLDIQNQDFTATGIGDMSGDVFGNGMLLSKHIRLIAAFDHRHIFLDPTPNAESSYPERRRLYDKPRSSWDDYNRSLLSPGGGIHPRTAKSIPVTPEAATALGLPESTTHLTPAALISAILRAPVDLLWNGGIGTYVKATTESHHDVGDKANNGIRVNGADLRARVVCEGGNLGLTQLGRIEYALQGSSGTGGLICTDAIDNSAGVDTSDHEVNIKILLEQARAAQEIDSGTRTHLLTGMTTEIATLVLTNNYSQNAALACAVADSDSLLNDHIRYLRKLVADGHLDRELEFLPTERVLEERQRNGKGLTQPELSVLLAYTKTITEDALLTSTLPEDPFFQDELTAYFPTALREAHGHRILTHPLRREIISTQVVNKMIDNAGITFVFRVAEESRAPVAEIARAHVTGWSVFGLDTFAKEISALDNQVPALTQTRMRLACRRLGERAARWYLFNRTHPLDVAAEVADFSHGVRTVATHLADLVRGSDAEGLARATRSLTDEGVPEQLAAAVAALPASYPALDIVEIAWQSGLSSLEVGRCYFSVVDNLRLGTLRSHISALPRTDRWQATARGTLLDDLYNAQAALIFDVLAAAPQSSGPQDRFEAWLKQNHDTVEEALPVLDEIAGLGAADLSVVSAGLRALRSLLSTCGCRQCHPGLAPTVVPAHSAHRGRRQ
ncbi:NAD-glutamate dehydrogenase (plasmid) [Kitasatospora sp. NBC_00070]|uniref:NAD-glutamate dehydrogenase n=1 Tax=Kitasatospora sp. NBC_00070 TaxID=2975962 RepID=UPI002F909E6D